MRQIGADRIADQRRIRQKRTRGRLSIHKRQTPLDPLADAVLRSARPCSKIQDSTLVRAQHRRTAQLRTEHLQGCPHRLLMVRHGRDPRQNVRHERDVCRPVAVNALRHIGDEVAVPQMPLSLRHTDQDEIVRICDLNEPRIHTREIHPHVIQHQSHFPALDQPQQVGTLPVNIFDAVQKAGNDDLTSGIFVVRKYLLHQHARVDRFQHRNRRNGFPKSLCSADHLRLPQRRQFEQIRHRNAHPLTLFSCILMVQCSFSKKSAAQS